jgi:hypothetical protein
MNAVHRAYINTGGILGVDAGFGNHVSHSESPLKKQRTGIKQTHLTTNVRRYHGTARPQVPAFILRGTW